MQNIKKNSSEKPSTKSNVLYRLGYLLLIWPFIFCLFISFPVHPETFGGDINWGFPFTYLIDVIDLDGDSIFIPYFLLNFLIAFVIAFFCYRLIKRQGKYAFIIYFIAGVQITSVFFFFDDKIPHDLPRYNWHPIYKNAESKVFLDHLESQYFGNKKCLFIVNSESYYKHIKTGLEKRGFDVKNILIQTFEDLSNSDLENLILKYPEYQLIVSTIPIFIKSSLKNIINNNEHIDRLPSISFIGCGAVISKKMFDEGLVLSICRWRLDGFPNLTGLGDYSSEEEIFERVFDLFTRENFEQKLKRYPYLVNDTYNLYD